MKKLLAFLKEEFTILVYLLYASGWVVVSKPTFISADRVIEYLRRYTKRVATSNEGIANVSDDKKVKYLTLEASEFIRRFLMHILPDRFVKIRHYGILGNRKKRLNLVKSRYLLGYYYKVKKSNEKKVIGKNTNSCPCCKS